MDIIHWVISPTESHCIDFTVVQHLIVQQLTGRHLIGWPLIFIIRGYYCQNDDNENIIFVLLLLLNIDTIVVIEKTVICGWLW